MYYFLVEYKSRCLAVSCACRRLTIIELFILVFFARLFAFYWKVVDAYISILAKSNYGDEERYMLDGINGCCRRC